jgi:hypothetical protein
MRIPFDFPATRSIAVLIESPRAACALTGGPAGLWVVEAIMLPTERTTLMPKKSSKTPQPQKTPAAPRISKASQVAALLTRDEGATLKQLIEATAWLPHTTRAALTGLKKKGYTISSDKLDGVRTYRAVAPE